jgi:nicotinamidase-related amidase
MPEKNEDLHGNVPDKADVALLLIDVINDLEFPEGDQLLRFARPMAERIVELKGRAKRAGIPTIYVNDNSRTSPSTSTTASATASAAVPLRSCCGPRTTTTSC